MLKKVSLKRVRDELQQANKNSYRIEQLTDAAVKASTARERTRDWRILMHLLSIEHVSEITMSRFIDVLAIIAEHYSPSRLEKMRSALVHRQTLDLPESERWTQDSKFRIAFRGLISECERRVKCITKSKYNTNSEEAGTQGPIFGQKLQELLLTCVEQRRGI